MENTESETPIQLDPKQVRTIAIAALVAVGILTIFVVTAYAYSRRRTWAIVLPGGITYIGQSPTPSVPAGTSSQPTSVQGKFTAAADAKWQEQKGLVFPYSFQYPANLTLVVFPGDPTDPVAISWNNVPAQQNILVRVEDLKLSEFGKKYISKSKALYVGDWWQQYSGGLKGAKEVKVFTNSNGFKGYRTRYVNHSDQTPNENVFFEIPGKSNLMVMFANGVLDQPVFDKMLDSFKWEK